MTNSNMKLWDGSFFINKMKQGRDQIVGKRWVCVDVDTDLDDKESIKLAIKKLKEQL
jgi:hypothetical protein